MDGWMDGYINGWMDGWMDGYIEWYKHYYNYLMDRISDLTEQQRGDIFLRAAQTGLLELIKELYTAYGKELLSFKDEDQYTALHRASYNGHKHIIEYLLNEGADIHSRTEDGWQPIHCACRWNKVEVASLLLQNEANINSLTNGHQTPLHLAACNNRSKATLELLLMHPGVDVTLRNSRGETARELADSLGQLGYLFEMKEECIDYTISRTKS